MEAVPTSTFDPSESEIGRWARQLGRVHHAAGGVHARGSAASMSGVYPKSNTCSNRRMEPTTFPQDLVQAQRDWIRTYEALAHPASPATPSCVGGSLSSRRRSGGIPSSPPAGAVCRRPGWSCAAWPASERSGPRGPRERQPSDCPAGGRPAGDPGCHRGHRGRPHGPGDRTARRTVQLGIGRLPARPSGEARPDQPQRTALALLPTRRIAAS